ncbi:Uncharacterised protein [Mycobacteroides abscessus subsp. abscessus]|nr:Uncharacterised protein [Mycobacteroides abscessus subsp. abscessus]
MCADFTRKILTSVGPRVWHTVSSTFATEHTQPLVQVDLEAAFSQLMRRGQARGTAAEDGYAPAEPMARCVGHTETPL